MKGEPQTRREQADYIVDLLSGFGVRISPSSRIGRMQRVLNRPEVIEPDDADYEIAVESMRDMYQLRLIVDTMDAHRDSRGFRDSVNFLRKDAALPQDDHADSPGRNYQFQVYVAALCTRAGLPTWHEEPDIRCDLDGAMFGIAVKRPKTVNAMEKNIKEAADQIRLAGMPGMIAMDLTVAQNPTNRRITFSSESQLYVQMSHAKLRALFEKKGEKIRQLIAGKGVLAVWVFESSIRLMPDRKWSHDCWSLWYDTTADEAELSVLEKFRPRFLSGVPNLVDFTNE
ncbi:hypothetical protein BH10PLA2_BH10PLA2_34460 [soil metagenome]